MGRYTYDVAVEMKEPETPPLPFNNPLLISRWWSCTILSKLHALSQLLSPWLPMLIPNCWCLCHVTDMDVVGVLSFRLVIVRQCWRWILMANCQWLWWVLIVFRGGCEKRGVAMCDIVFLTSPHFGCVKWCCSYFFHPWHQVEDGPYPPFGSVPLYVHPCS